jgi:hypothetical protein
MEGMTMKMKTLIGSAVLLGVLLCGCSTVRDVVDEYRDWRDSQTNAPAVPPDAPDTPPATPGTPTQPDTPASDEADYSAFSWAYGGFNGARAALDKPRIESLRMNGMSGLSYRWAGPNLSAWGIAHTDATVTNAIAKPFNDVLFRAQKRAAIKPHLPIASERDGDSVVLIYEDGRRETKTLKRAFSVRPEKALARKAIEAEVSRLMKEGDAKEVLQELQKVQLTIGSKEPSKPAIK